MRGCIPPNYRMKGTKPMKKELITYNITEDDMDAFAVIPHENLQAIAQLVTVIKNQMNVLETLLENSGITQYSFEKKTKTLSDLKAERDKVAG